MHIAFKPMTGKVWEGLLTTWEVCPEYGRIEEIFLYRARQTILGRAVCDLLLPMKFISYHFLHLPMMLTNTDLLVYEAVGEIKVLLIQWPPSAGATLKQYSNGYQTFNMWVLQGCFRSALKPPFYEKGHVNSKKKPKLKLQEIAIFFSFLKGRHTVQNLSHWPKKRRGKEKQ